MKRRDLKVLSRARLPMRSLTRGFSLLEILLVLALIAGLLGISIPIYYGFQQRGDLNSATQLVVQSLNRARGRASAGDGDSRWGLHVEAGKIIVFQGNSFATRVVASDEKYDISTSITASGDMDIVFEKISGFVVGGVSKSLTLTAASIGSKTVSINAKGVITY